MRAKRKKSESGGVKVHPKRQCVPHAASGVPDEPDEDQDPMISVAGKEFCTVKCSLRSICKDPAKALPWGSVLKDTNKALKEAYVFANLRVIILLEAGQPIPVLDKCFFSQCLRAVSAVQDARQVDDDIDDIDLRRASIMYWSWRDPNIPFADRAYISANVFLYASAEMMRSTKTHIVKNFYRRFDQYLMTRFNMTGLERRRLLRNVLEPRYEGNDERVITHRNYIPRNENGYLDTESAHLILPVTYCFLRFIEHENYQHQMEPDYRALRVFSLLPYKKGYECSHCTFSKHGLFALMRRAGVTVNEQYWNNNVHNLWDALFDIRKFETRNRRFAGLIVTDGVAVSMLFRRPAKPKTEINVEPWNGGRIFLNADDYDEVWGLDPGRRNLLVATNSTGDTVRCTSGEFYDGAKYIASNKTTRYWKDHDPDVLQAIRSMLTPKTCSLHKLEVYVRFLIPRLDLLLNFGLMKPFRKLRFRRFVFMKRKLRELCLMLTATAGKRTLVGFGDWSATDPEGHIKRCQPGGPVKKLKDELRRYCTVALIPEFRTSKLHAGCHQELTYMQRLQRGRDGVERRVRVFGVLHCFNNGCQGTTVNRDTNASQNILLLTQYYLANGVRHPDFRRPTFETRGRAI